MLDKILLLAAGSGSEMATDVALIVVCVLVGFYLFAALLWPEKF